MKKPLVIILSVVAGVIVLIFSLLIYGRFSMMSEMRLEHPEIPIGPLPLSPDNLVVVAPGMPFRIDTGSSVNTISTEYLARLRKLGFEVDSSRVLMLVHNALDEYRVVTKRYRVTLPVYNYDINMSADGKVLSRVDSTNIINKVHCVDFVPVSHPNEIPRMGRPMLAKFKVEYDYRLRSLLFHRGIPAQYYEFCDIKTGPSLLSSPERYIYMTVNGRTRSFYMNSSMPYVAVKMPYSEHPEVNGHSIYNDSISSVYGKFKAVIDCETWLEWGNRAGNTISSYVDYGGYPYAVNMFNFLTQNAVIDLENNKVYLWDYSPKNHQARESDAFAIL